MAPSPKPPVTLFEVLDSTCTHQQIHKMMQAYKDLGISELRLSGTKPELIASLQSAVSKDRIPETAIYDLIRDHEEAGGQHLFYFKPKNASAVQALNDGLGIGNAIIPTRSAREALPNFSLVPNDYVWADFRVAQTGKSWTAKIYGHQERVVFKRQEVRPASVVRYYDKVEKRVVCLAHWNGKELELRVSHVGAGGSIDASRSRTDDNEIMRRVNKLQEFIAPAGLMQLVVSWDFTTACVAMLKKVMDEKKRGISSRDSELPFITSSVRFRDAAFGTAEFNSQEETEALASSGDRMAAIEAYLESPKAFCRQLVLSWDPVSASELWGKSPLRTVIGGTNSNELSIIAGVNSATVKYVTDELRKYST